MGLGLIAAEETPSSGPLLVLAGILVLVVAIGFAIHRLTRSRRGLPQGDGRQAAPPMASRTVPARPTVVDSVAQSPTAAAGPPPAPSPAPAPSSGQGAATLSAGRFTPLDELGRGGMGVVWRATDNLLGREVAIKQLLPPATLATDARSNLRARMLREARAVARLDHRNAVTVHDVLLDDDAVLIVMELVKAPSLEALVRRDGPLPPVRVAAVGLAILDVLSAAHRLGIVHRDVKPANVLVREDGTVKLADFGIARFEGDPTLTEAGAVIGTPAYMAPEQIRGLDSTPATDLWGLGATLFYAAEGHPAFGGPTPTAAMAAVLTDPPRPPDRTPPKLGALLTALLAKAPEDRPDVAALRDELARVR